MPTGSTTWSISAASARASVPTIARTRSAASISSPSADYRTESVRLQYNPDVTVRSRGVMEKCSYCVQRIRHAEIDAQVEGRGIFDGEILTACQAACPAQAIVFGDMNDSRSKVKQGKDSPLHYSLLADLEHESAHDLPGGVAKSEPGAGGGVTWQTHEPATPAQPEPRLTSCPRHSFRSVTDKISAIVLARPTGWLWHGGLAVSIACDSSSSAASSLTCSDEGVGIWGIDIPVAWGFAITNFVWWIGIGHAGTLISAILLLLHQRWRTSINRIAEAMTIFAVMCAGLFPLLHLGRPWFFYWLLPYPNTMWLWPQFRSALVWDVFAVSTYFTVSLLFWYMGMIPDLATLRDRATSRAGQIVYGMLALGWRNSARHWQRFEAAYLLLGGLATPLVVSVHSVVSSDFAISMCRAGTRRCFRPTSSPGPYFPGSRWCVILCDSAAALLRPARFHHVTTTSK